MLDSTRQSSWQTAGHKVMVVGGHAMPAVGTLSAYCVNHWAAKAKKHRMVLYHAVGCASRCDGDRLLARFERPMPDLARRAMAVTGEDFTLALTRRSMTYAAMEGCYFTRITEMCTLLQCLKVQLDEMFSVMLPCPIVPCLEIWA